MATSTPVDPLSELLARGFLPVQLPPGFTSASFAAALPGLAAKLEGIGVKKLKSLPSRFSVPRSSYYRRNTALVNPIAYFHLASAISSNWLEIQVHYAWSTLSRSVPNIEAGSLRAIQLRKFSELYEEKVKASAGYKYALVTDITGFFPTIYTHSIPWALHGKVAAKAARTDKTLLGNVLDAGSRRLQDDQTIGLPIGPDTSHILAEIIGVGIDLALEQQLGNSPPGFRYVDDFYLFATTREQAEQYLAAVTRAIASMELQISPSKTRIIEVRDLVDESWKYGLKKLQISSESKKEQRDDIHHFFEVLFNYEKRFKDESLVKYGLKQATSTIIKKSNWDIFEAYLLKCGYSFPNTIQIVCQLLATYAQHHYKLNYTAIMNFCDAQLKVMAANDCHGEVAWLLWIYRELALAPTKEAVEKVLDMGNPVTTLILLHLEKTGASGVVVDGARLAALTSKDSLWESDWILAYEAGRRGWLAGGTAFIDNDPHFKVLKAANVGFYDTDRRCAPVFERRDVTSEIDFDSDRAIERGFQFDDLDEEYFDSSKRGEEPEDEGVSDF